VVSIKRRITYDKKLRAAYLKGLKKVLLSVIGLLATNRAVDK